MSETIPAARKTAPAGSTSAETFYGERNTGIRLVSTGKVDEGMGLVAFLLLINTMWKKIYNPIDPEAEAARKALIRSMGAKPKNRWTWAKSYFFQWVVKFLKTITHSLSHHGAG